ncbi:hypothetical protein [Dactylosporangium darangshiense]|uniref:ATP-binding protein n=1 Tax=Dactylosporangium darangshiense TaxID=579108 RepID=A0ABP8DQS3_9ACTN
MQSRHQRHDRDQQHERTTPLAVLADVARTHPCTARPGCRHEPNPQYTEPKESLLEPQPPVPDPIQAGPPVAELPGPTPAQDREALRTGRLDEIDAPDDLTLVVSEIVTNAHPSGRPPVRMRVWAGRGGSWSRSTTAVPARRTRSPGCCRSAATTRRPGWGCGSRPRPVITRASTGRRTAFTVRLTQRAP